MKPGTLLNQPPPPTPKSPFANFFTQFVIKWPDLVFFYRKVDFLKKIWLFYGEKWTFSQTW